MTVLIGTAGGLHEVSPEGGRVHLEDRDVTAVDGLGWALLEDHEVVHCEHGTWRSYGRLPADLHARCLLTGLHGLLLGVAGGHLVRMDDDGFEILPSFETAAGRDGWYTPWGGPPDTRSLAEADDGTLYANVHVGGILRSTDQGTTWEPTIDIDVDVHQVVTVPGTATVVAATGTGLALSYNGGDSWTMEVDGLDGTYLRGVAVAEADGTVVVSASTGPHGGRSALYRRPLSAGPFERIGEGLPDSFPANIDSGWIAAQDDRVAVAGPDGSVFRSTDGGRSFALAAEGLPTPRWLAFSAA